MTRIAFVADSHFDEGSRFEECIRIHQWIAEDIAERGVDLLIHGGDLYERKSTPRERAAVAEWLHQVGEHCPVVMVRGNHDAPGDLSLLARLRTRHPIIVEEAAGVHLVAGVAVGCLAWPRKAELLAMLEEAGREESEQVAQDALRNVLGGLGSEMAQHEGPSVLVAHAMVRASRVSTGQPLVGCDLEVGLDDLALARPDLTLLGHIHLPQEWEGPVVYSGSPRRTAFGEVEEKGYVVADVATAGLAAWQRVPTPATRMLLIGGQVTDVPCPETGEDHRGVKVDHNPSDEEIAGAEIRLRYKVAADERDVGRESAEGWKGGWLTRGASVVKLEEDVIATTRARAPEVATAVTLADKLRALWGVRGEDLDEDRRTVLLGKAMELEEEVRHAV